MKLNRRKLLLIGGATVFGGGFWGWNKIEQQSVIGEVMPFSNFTDENLFVFLDNLKPSEKRLINESLGFAPEKVGSEEFKTYSSELDIDKIRWRLSELTRHKFVNWKNFVGKIFRGKPPAINYDKKVEWAWKEFKARDYYQSTFSKERAIIEAFAEQTWSDMSTKKREEFLKNAGVKDSLATKALAKGTDPTNAITMIRGGVKKNGFRFYCEMSKFIAGTGRLFGATLPFGVYTAASTVVKVLSGPVGWAIQGAVFLVQHGLFGFPKPKNIIPFIFAIHTLKALKLEEVNALESVTNDLNF